VGRVRAVAPRVLLFGPGDDSVRQSAPRGFRDICGQRVSEQGRRTRILGAGDGAGRENNYLPSWKGSVAGAIGGLAEDLGGLAWAARRKLAIALAAEPWSASSFVGHTTQHSTGDSTKASHEEGQKSSIQQDHDNSSGTAGIDRRGAYLDLAESASIAGLPRPSGSLPRRDFSHRIIVDNVLGLDWLSGVRHGRLPPLTARGQGAQRRPPFGKDGPPRVRSTERR